MKSEVFIKGYQVKNLIDQTGLRSLYKGIQLATGQHVFITLIPARVSSAKKRLNNRAEQSKKLLHPGLSTAIDYGTSQDDTFFCVQPAQPSLPITQVLSELRNPTDHIYATCSYMMQVLDSLTYLHEAGTTHRDLSTAQIRINRKNKTLLEGFINPKPRIEPRNVMHIVHYPYLSPEQLKGAPADIRCDLYGIGVILYELITGSLPYSSNYSKIEAHREGRLANPADLNPACPPQLTAVVIRCLSNRANRYRVAEEITHDLESIYSKRSIQQKIKDFSSSLKQLLELKS